MLRSATPSKRALTVVPLLYAALAVLQLVVPALGFEDPAEAAGPTTGVTHSARTTQAASHSAPTAAQEEVDAARRAGCTMADTARRATRDAGIPYYVGCAFLLQETGGGRNVFGSDPTVFAGAGEVTRSKYLAYKEVRETHRRGAGHRADGADLAGVPDRADRLGGAGKRYANMLVGFRHLAALHRASGQLDRRGARVQRRRPGGRRVRRADGPTLRPPAKRPRLSGSPVLSVGRAGREPVPDTDPLGLRRRLPAVFGSGPGIYGDRSAGLRLLPGTRAASRLGPGFTPTIGQKPHEIGPKSCGF